MANIRRTSQGKYSVRWHAPDGRHRQRTCPTHRAAKQLKLEVEASLALGRDWEPAVARGIVDLEHEVLVKFVQYKSARLRSRTLRRYAENLDIFVRFLRTRQRGRLTPRLLTRPNLEDFYHWLQQPENGLWGRARSKDTARKIVEVVQLAWRWAYDSERWPDLIPLPRRIDMMRAPAVAVHAPTWAEMDACVHQLSGWKRELAVILRYTGLRVSETMQLRWELVDLERGRLTILRQMDKSGRGRTIPISHHLSAEMASWGQRDGYVVSYSGKQERHKAALAKYFNAAWAAAEIRSEVWTGNSTKAFRKGIKSGLLRMQASPDAVDFLQGHQLGVGARRSYIDAGFLPLEETVALIPKITRPNPASLVIVG